MDDVTLDEQIACVDRELRFRRKTYPRFIARNALTEQAATDELRRMEAVRGTLVALRTAGPDLSATLTAIGVRP